MFLSFQETISFLLCLVKNVVDIWLIMWCRYWWHHNDRSDGQHIIGKHICNLLEFHLQYFLLNISFYIIYEIMIFHIEITVLFLLHLKFNRNRFVTQPKGLCLKEPYCVNIFMHLSRHLQMTLYSLFGSTIAAIMTSFMYWLSADLIIHHSDSLQQLFLLFPRQRPLLSFVVRVKQQKWRLNVLLFK